MAEVSFVIANQQALTVRLEPTDVRGGNLAGQLILRLPFKLLALPRGGPQAGYVLVRLAGSIISPPVGEIWRFEAGPLAEASHPAPTFWRQVEVFVEVDRLQAERFEHGRSGANAQLLISLSGLILLAGEQKFEAVVSQGQLQLVVPRSHWVDEVVSRWGLSSVKVIEVAFPASAVGENYRAAYQMVEAAERFFANGQYKQALAELYSAFESLAKSQGFSKPDQQYFASLLADQHSTKKESLKLALDKLCDFLHLGRHEPKDSPETFVILRRDARFALTMAHAVFEYITVAA
jgi:hypothetical protein